MNDRNITKANSPNQFPSSKKKFSADFLEAVVWLLLLGSLGLAFLDPSIRPQFLDLTNNVVLALALRASLSLTQDSNIIDRTD